MTSDERIDGWDYQKSGVDLEASDNVIDGIKNAVESTFNPRVLRGLGHFGGFYRVGPAGDQATLVASIDGVGTKLKIAILARQHHSIGADIVNHCVNDILAGGARPLFFLDYFATGALDPEVAVEVVGGIASACRLAGIALLGGETAEMPGIYSNEDYDLAGVVVGIVDQNDIIDGSRIQPGDAIIGIPSSGFHTNGYSLIRAALGLNSDDDNARRRLQVPLPYDPSRTLAEALLEPHRGYESQIRLLLDQNLVRGMAHITGGGIGGNLGRIIPGDMSAEVDIQSWDIPPLFDFVAEIGNIPLEECFRVFNMGIGFIVVCSEADADAILNHIDGSRVIGKVAEGNVPVELIGLE